MRYVKLIPEDTLLFRDDTRMEKGPNVRVGNWEIKDVPNLVKSRLMPYSSVFWGTIYTALLRKGLLPDASQKLMNGEILRTEVLEKDLAIEFLGLYRDEKVLIPAPLDLFYDNDRNVSCAEFNRGKFNVPQSDRYKVIYERSENMYIGLTDFFRFYSEGIYKGITLYSESEIITYDHRTGIELKNRNVVDGHLYRIEMISFVEEYSGYVIGFRALDTDAIEGPVTLGGERKVAYLEEIPDMGNELIQYDERQCNSKNVRINLLAPLIIPEMGKGVNAIEYLSTLLPENIRLEGIATSNAESFSGYDIAADREKEAVISIGAGSVLYMSSEEFIGKDYAQIRQIINESFRNLDQFYKGFGTYLISEYQEGCHG